MERLTKLNVSLDMMEWIRNTVNNPLADEAIDKVKEVIECERTAILINKVTGGDINGE